MKLSPNSQKSRTFKLFHESEVVRPSKEFKHAYEVLSKCDPKREFNSKENDIDTDSEEIILA